MNAKTFFPFFLILALLVILVLGCTGGNDGLSDQTTSAKFSKGIFNTTVKINGADKTEVSLGSKQSAEIGIVVKNDGPNSIKNVTIRSIGCVDTTSPADGIARTASLPKGSLDYFSWSVRAPELGTSESFSCPFILRACFEETSNGYFEINILPDAYSDVPGTVNNYYQSGIFSTEPNFGFLRIVTGDNGLYYGSLKITNKGGGWIDYVNQSADLNLEMYKIKRITMNLSENSGLSFDRIGELSKKEMTGDCKGSGAPTMFDLPTISNYLIGIGTTQYCCKIIGIKSTTPFLATHECYASYTLVQPMISDNGKSFNINSGSTMIGNSDYDYFLKLIGGKELDLRLGFNVTNPASYKTETFERVNYEIESGYCIDLASLNIKLSGH